MTDRITVPFLAVAIAHALCASLTLARPNGEPAAPVFDNTFNAPAGANALTGKRNAIVIAHGWNSGPQFWEDHPTRPANQRTNLRDNIVAQLGAAAANYDIWVLDWSADSTDTGSAPFRATEIRAEKQGAFVARNLIAQNSYENVHFIGHSLGGRVIETASTIIKQKANAPVIHTTFLDAYTPYFWDRIYGSTSDWSEHIYNRDNATNTQANLPFAMNVDATARRDDDADRPTSINPFTDTALAAAWGHGWPRRMYVRSARDVANNPRPFSGYGYPHSKEVAGNNWPVANRNRSTQHTLNANGTVTIAAIDRIIVTNPVAIPLTNQAVKNRSQLVTLTDGMLCLPAASGQGAWARINFTTTAPTNFFQFEFMFDVQQQMTLTAFIRREGQTTDSMLFQADDVNRLGDWESTGKVSVPFSLGGFAFDLVAGNHTLAFRLDTTSDLGAVWVRNITGGRIAVPAPGGGASFMVAVGLLAIRRRRPAIPVANVPLAAYVP